jgi:hypothetical protein
LLLALSPLPRPRVFRHVAPRPVARGAREEAALAAALLIGGQLLLGYWFYSYLTWFYPLLVIAMMQASDPI